MFRHVPNIITIARLVLAVVFFVILAGYQHRGRGDPTLLNVAFAVYLVALISDFFDGYLARKWKTESQFGRIVDPFVDKVLVLGSFVVKQVSQSDYPLALAQTLFAIAVLLVTLSWLWSPRSSFVGIGHLLSRYLMSLGLPFERWVQRLADFADKESDPQRFLAQAL